MFEDVSFIEKLEEFQNHETMGSDDESSYEHIDVNEYDRGQVDNSEDVIVIDNDPDPDMLRAEVEKAVNRYMSKQSEVVGEASAPEEEMEEDEEVQKEPVYVFNLQAPGVDTDSVSLNQCVILDSSQLQILLDAINENTIKTAPVVVAPDSSVSSDLIGIQNTGEANFITSIMIFGLLFGYMAKETIFRGV